MHLRDELADAAKTVTRIGWPGVRFHPTAFVMPSTIIFPDAFIGANVSIGPDCVIGPGATIGAPGFGYDKLEDGSWQYRTHPFGVLIEADVHIGASANIAAGRHRATIIREGSRIDALTHVGHNCHVGRNALVVALSMLGGTTEVGDGAYVASGTVRDHVTLGEGSMVGLGAVVTRDIPAGETWAGVPAKRLEPKPEPDPNVYVPPFRCNACILSAARGEYVLYCGDCDPRA